MKRLAKVLAISLTIAMLATLFACTPGQETTTTTTSAQSTTGTSSTSGEELEWLELSVVTWDVANSFRESDSEDRMRTYFEDKFKATFDPWNVTWGDYTELIWTWAAANTLPDIVGGIAIVGSPTYNQWISDGVFTPLPGDLSAYPEVRRMVEQPTVSVYMVEGNNYLMPRMTYDSIDYWCMERGIVSRKDWRENLGIDVPVTEQDFIDLTVAFATMDPDGDNVHNTTGMSITDSWMFLSQVWAGFGFTDERWMWAEDGESVVIPSLEDTSLPALSFFRRMNKAGGLDPDFATYGSSGARTAFCSGKLGMLSTQNDPGTMNGIRTEWNSFEDNPPFLEAIEILNPPLHPGKQYVGFMLQPYWSETYVSAGVDDVKMDRILQIFDYLYSKEGSHFVRYGFEGEDWEWDGDEISILTDINPDTNEQYTAGELYPFASGGMAYLAAWNKGMGYDSPYLPQDLRNMLREELARRQAEWVQPKMDFRLSALVVPEVQQMTVSRSGEWIRFISDTSDKSDEDLFAEMQAEWYANGYLAAKNALTDKAAEMGYTPDNMP